MNTQPPTELAKSIFKEVNTYFTSGNPKSLEANDALEKFDINQADEADIQSLRALYDQFAKDNNIFKRSAKTTTSSKDLRIALMLLFLLFRSNQDNDAITDINSLKVIYPKASLKSSQGLTSLNLDLINLGFPYSH